MTASATESQKVLVDKKYAIPVANIEALPVATLASVDLNANGTTYGAESTFLETTVESTLGGVIVYSSYQAILTFLKSETARREGEITRGQQLKLIATTALDAGRSSAFTMLVASAIVALMPWLTMPLMVLGVVGSGFMASKVGTEFWGALTDEQRGELRRACDSAKVNLERLVPNANANKPQTVAVAAV